MSAGMSLAKAGRRLTGTAAVLFGLVLVTGCDPADPYPTDLSYPLRTDLLVLNYDEANIPAPEPLGSVETMIDRIREKDKTKVIDPTDLERLDQLERKLEDLFGTPAEPTVKTRNTKLIKTLSLDDKTLAAGSVLYRRHCVHCHGLTGDGRGPTAPWVHPHPRDYRRGLFKFTSVKGGGKPRREDLMRTLYEGIEGTSMPNFRVLPEEQRSEMISYIIHLSIRGEVEYEVMKGIHDKVRGNVDSQATAGLKNISDDWAAAQEDDARIMPHKYPYTGDPADPPKESIERGFRLFNGDAACIGCHTDYGRNSPFRYDKWGTLVRPANLTAVVYRGGRRPVDIYYRIHSGVNPSNMAGTSETIANDDQKMWDLVNFVKALPYPAMLPDKVRDEVYGPGRK
ncbi:MAG: cytochrome c [Planctomycetes bacterium]|nr:cytochrome c [Planctomycetota bacterium]